MTGCEDKSKGESQQEFCREEHFEIMGISYSAPWAVAWWLNVQKE